MHVSREKRTPDDPKEVDFDSKSQSSTQIEHLYLTKQDIISMARRHGSSTKMAVMLSRMINGEIVVHVKP